MMHFTFPMVVLALALSASARVVKRQGGFTLKNGQDAIALNERFQKLNANSPCNIGENACVEGKFAQCVSGRFVTQACAPGTICAGLPLVNAPGTTITCTTQSDLESRIAATGAKAGNRPPANGEGQNGGNGGNNNGGNGGGNNNGGNGGNNGGNNNGGNGGGNNNGGNGGDPSTSLTLNPAVISDGFKNDGQGVPEPGQVASLTSSNNFINFCLGSGLPLTNGKQIPEGSCNTAPMGMIPAKNKMPSSKFVFPKNGGTVRANEKFTVQMAIRNLETGNFVNAKQNYYSAPQQLNAQGIIRGHSHVVIEKLQSLDQTVPLNPETFQYFKGLNNAAQNGILTADVIDGLPAGVYRMSSINSAANHQPALAPIAQRGSLDDAIYFTAA